MVKNLSAMQEIQETQVRSLGWEDPLEGMATHSSILAWRIPWTEEAGRLQPMGLQTVGHDWVTSLSLSWRPTRPFRTNNQKRCTLHYRGLECKTRKSRNTWSNGKIWPWSTQWSRAKANRVRPRECTDYRKHPLPTTREDSKNGHHQMVNIEIRLIIYFAAKMEKLYIVSKSKTGSWLQLRWWTPYCQIQT